MAPVDDAPAVTAGAFRPATLRGRAGFFCAGQDGAGRWWLSDPAGEPFFVRAVHGVRGAPGQTDGALPLDSAARLRSWAFNAVGVSAETVGRDDGLPFLAAVDFIRAGPSVVGAGVRLPDVFDPEWPKWAANRALEVCAPLAVCREVIGWVTDDRLEWAGPTPAGRPSLLQICLSLEPGLAAYHAAWEFVLALHGGRIEAVSRAWSTPLANKEVVRELTRVDHGLATRGYLRDDARWSREFARRYFGATAAAIRAADPNHLVLGCRFGRRVGPSVIAECVYPAIDVALLHWSDLPPVDASPSQPVLANDLAWPAEELRAAPPVGRPRRLTSVERMLRRARVTLDRIARHPAVVGYAWSQWQDEPGEQPPFGHGLVHVNGAEAREHTEVLAPFNLRAENLHRVGP